MNVDHLAPVFAQYPIEIVSADGVYLTTRTAGASSISTAATPSRRSATATPT